MAPTDIMIDLETLGTVPGSVILSIGAVAAPDVGPPFNQKITVASSLYAGLTVDADTLAWWRKQDSAAWEESTQGGIDLKVALKNFADWLNDQRPGDLRLRLWGDAASFDLVLLACAYRAVGLPVPWKYTEEYDYRTLRQLLNSRKPEGTLKHSALSDATAQMGHLQELLVRVSGK